MKLSVTTDEIGIRHVLDGAPKVPVGVFEADPARAPAARKLAEVDYAEALRVAGPLVHDKAVRFAAARGLPIEVGVIGSLNPIRIAAGWSDAATNGR